MSLPAIAIMTTATTQDRLNEIRRALPLTAEQRRIVLSELHLYFAGFYQRAYPYQRPTFAVVRQTFHPDDVPDDLSVGEATRRGKGTPADPTYSQAMVLLYGPSPVSVYRGEREPVDAAVFKRLAAQLPTHLAAMYDFILVKQRRYVDAPVGRRLAAEYAHQALEVVASWLYDQRWSCDAEN